MSEINEMLQDLEEINKLIEVAKRPRIRNLLIGESEKLKFSLGEAGSHTEGSGMVKATEETSAAPGVSSQVRSASAVSIPTVSVTRTTPQRFYKDITTYAWDQSDNFMKIYVTLKGVEKLSKEQVTSEYQSKSFCLKVDNLNGANYTCRVAGLWGRILPQQSYHKVKSDTVLLMLKKEEEKKTWAYLTEREDKKKPPPKLDEKRDPNEGLMDLLKQMYDEGDDEMKRTIAKSWTESRNKQAT